MSPRLYVNLDHVATLRQVRGATYPDVLEAALLAERSGHVDGITLHLREDRRHVQDADVERVMHGVALPFNYEMSTAEDIVQHALRMKPPQATLVPERRQELTTEGGLDLVAEARRLREVTQRLHDVGTKVSFFIAPEAQAVERSLELGADCVELHTGPWAHAHHALESAKERARLEAAAASAQAAGLVLNAGHGLTTSNVGPVARLPKLVDLNIGHAIVARAVMVGLTEALREMRAAITMAAMETAPPHRGNA
jgi:pyridoxine 5-phosphate synthase